MDSVPIWVRLPGLPLHYWKEEHLRAIGNILGTFIEADLAFERTNLKQVARILVNINIREGLAEEMTLTWGPVKIRQVLDYENVPFRCRRCHAYGHPASECRLPLNTRKGKRPMSQESEKELGETDSGTHSSLPRIRAAIL